MALPTALNRYLISCSTSSQVAVGSSHHLFVSKTAQAQNTSYGVAFTPAYTRMQLGELRIVPLEKPDFWPNNY
jgi:hypothetical protein